MHDRPESTSLECSGPLAILFLHGSTPHHPTTLTCSLGQLGQHVRRVHCFRKLPETYSQHTTCLWVWIQLSSQGAQLRPPATLPGCMNAYQQHCRSTSVRHLAIQQSDQQIIGHVHRVARNHQGVQTFSNHYYNAHHLFVGAHSTTWVSSGQPIPPSNWV